MEKLSIKCCTFELFDKKVHLLLKTRYENIFSFFFKKLNNLEDWDFHYDYLLRELIILDMGIIDPTSNMSKIKELYLVEKRNKNIENILKN